MSSGSDGWRSAVSGTEEQIEALTSDKYLTVVSAGAGSGKTQTLAGRFAWLLANDPECGADEILVLTFTKKAAREMRDRIKKTLVKWYEAYPKELPHLKKSIENIDDAYISTIHSFAMKLIRESGLVLDIDPTSAVIPAPTEDVWWGKFAENLSETDAERLLAKTPASWRKRARELFSDPDFTNVLNSFDAADLVKAIKEGCTEKLYSAGKSPEDLWNYDDEELIKSVASLSGVKREFYALWTQDVFPRVAEALPKFGGGKETKDAWRDFTERWGAVRNPTDDDCENFCLELFEEMIKNIRNSKITDSIEEGLGVTLKKWREENKPLFALSRVPSDGERRVNKFLCRLFAFGWACWDEYRRGENMMTLADLIYYSSAVLRSSAEYKKKFKHIMVDEFQDTDPLQDALIKALWVEPSEESDFRNTLFVVGDLKQSIYRFRHADLTLFRSYISRARERKAENYAKFVSLTQNFRTAGTLLAKFNSVFGDLWNGDGEITYEQLCPPKDRELCGKRNALVKEPSFEMIYSTAAPKEKKEGEEKGAEGKDRIANLRLRLYRELGRRFSDMLASEYQIWDKGEQEFRDARWKDFAVLVRGRGEYASIERAFDDLGVPYILTTSQKYFSRGETGDLINFISLLANPQDAALLAGWLASPFSGASQEEAQSIVFEALKRRSGRGALPLFAALSEKRPDLAAKIDNLRRRAMLSGVASAIFEVLSQPSFLEKYDGFRRRRVNANIISLAQLAEEYERSQGKSLKGCAEYLSSAAKGEDAKEEPDALDEATDAVRVMTVHAAKGLEFPVVALIYGAVDGKNEKAPVLVSKKYGVIARNIPEFLSDESGAARESVAGLWERRLEKEAQAAEEKRVWYVGFTRAQDKLFFCSASKTPIDGELFENLPVSENGENVTNLTEDENERSYFKPRPAADASKELILRTETPAKLGRLSASAYALISWCPAAYRAVYRQGRTINWTVKGGEGGGSDFGSLTHEILKKWNFTPQELVELLPEKSEGALFDKALREISVELREKFANDKTRGKIRELLFEYSKSDECGLFAKLASEGSPLKLQRETRFRVPDGGTTLVGSTDIFWEDERGFHLRDWKTAAEQFAPDFYYERQLEFYAYALRKYCEKKGNEAPLDTSLIYLRASDGERNVRKYSEKDFEAIALTIEAAAVQALSGGFPGVSERCGVCPWRGACHEYKK